jgi:hypothetical protein
MAEAAAMLRELGIAPRMSEQTAQWQRLIGKQELAPPPGTLSGKLAAIRANPDEKGDI